MNKLNALFSFIIGILGSLLLLLFLYVLFVEEIFTPGGTVILSIVFIPVLILGILVEFSAADTKRRIRFLDKFRPKK